MDREVRMDQEDIPSNGGSFSFKRLRAIFWDIIANLGGLAGLLALAYPVFSLAFKPAVNQNPDVHQLVVFCCWILGLSFTAVFLLTVVQWRKIRDIRGNEFLHAQISSLQDQKENVALIVHNLTHNTRNQIQHLSAATEVLPKIPKDSQNELIEQIERNWAMFNVYYMDNLKAMFDALTGETNSVCLKMVRKEFVKSQPEARAGEAAQPLDEAVVKTVKTLYRDTSSHRLRRENDIRLAKYVADSNSAFSTILSGDTKHFYFLSNDLSKDTKYVNTNPRWREFYNATMVGPIRIERFFDNDTSSEQYVTWGFICVDAKRGRYTNVELELLLAFCDLYFPLFYAFDVWRKCVESLRPATPSGGSKGLDVQPTPLSS